MVIQNNIFSAIEFNGLINCGNSIKEERFWGGYNEIVTEYINCKY